MAEHPHRRPDRRPPGGTPSDASTPDRVRLPLLTLITQQSLDEDYQRAAERRVAGAPRPPAGRPVRVAAVVVGVFGALVATAFVQTSENADADSANRNALIARVEAATERRARQEQRATRLRDRVAALERANLGLVDDEQVEALEARRLQVRTGFVAVRGEGVRVTVTQRPDADENQQVKDRDLRLVVNGLFAAGAEAVAVNGQRMSATTGIRTSGQAIRVNDIGIAPPYVVEAIGDTRTLAARFAASTTGQEIASLGQFYDFEVDVDDNVADLRLPAAPPSKAGLGSARELAEGPRPEDGEDPGQRSGRSGKTEKGDDEP
jgi:uncharacterized protein YlxW (UPF0749 family)